MNVKQIAALQTPAKIEWHENEDGELEDNSFYAYQSVSRISAIDHEETMVSSPSGHIVAWTENNDGELEDSQQNDETPNHDNSFRNPSAKSVKTLPSPARVKLEWQEESQLQDGVSIPPASLLHESLIESDCQPDSEQLEDESGPKGHGLDRSLSQLDNEMQLSAPSLQTSEIGTTDLVEFDSDRNTQTQLKNAGQNFAYLAKIEELEQNLKEQIMSKDQTQSKLKVRVVELEQALRVTVATPRGTIVQQNPLKTLLDRNETLVKEVRFADQTCVELSSTISALEAQNKILQNQVQNLEEDNDALRQENQEYNQESADKQRMIHEYEKDMKTFDGDIYADQRDAKMDTSITLSSDIHSVEMSKARSETDFLGRQLGIVQEKLDMKVRELEEERSRFQHLEEQWQTENEKHLLKIEALEKATEHMYLYKDGPTSPRLLDADKLVFALEKELAHAKASIVALRRESGKMQSKEATSSDQEDSATIDALTLQMVQEALSQIHERYRNLDKTVEEIVGSYVERLERLTDTVEYLRSSLLFEAESTSTQLQDEAGHKMMAASIGSCPDSIREDEMLSLMEEARSPCSTKCVETDEDSSDPEDISQLFYDDETLGSVTKNGSVVTSVTPDCWREPLEAAIKECRRVKERSSKLKQEIDTHKTAIQTLEFENGKLSLEASRKGEEKRMIETALEEAKQIIDELRSKLKSTEEARERALESDREKGEEVKLHKENEQTIESDLRTEHAKQEVLEKRILELDQILGETRRKLHEASNSSAGYKARCDNLLVQLERKAHEVAEEKDGEIIRFAQRLKDTENQVEEMKQSHREATEKLTRAVEENVTFQKLIYEIQAQKETCISEAEDDILESQCNLEAIRRERAELRAKLSRKEMEISSVKEAYFSSKKKAQTQLDQQSSSIQTLQSEQSEIFMHCKELEKARKELFELLLSIGCCTDAIRELTTSEMDVPQDNETSRCVRELAYWIDIVPHVGDSMQSLSQTKSDFDQLLKEAAILSEDLNLLKTSENEYKQQIEEERKQNEKFYTLLRQAELEMERSAKQIREMSGALSMLQQKEAEANDKLKTGEYECVTMTQDFQRAQTDMTLERSHLQKKITDLLAELEDKESRLSEMNGLL
jgi:chromosome segregation ATPase